MNGVFTLNSTKSNARSHRLAFTTSWLLAAWCSVITVLPAQAATATPAPCKLVSSDARVDYGRFSPYDLPPADPTAPALSLGKRIITLHATCDTPQRMTLFFRGEADGTDAFRFGPKGRLVIRLLKAQLDGKPAALGQVKSAALRPASTATSAAITPEAGALVAGAGQRLGLQVEIEASVPHAAMHPRIEETWRTNGRFVLETRSPD